MHNAIHKVFIPVVVGGMAMPVRAHNGDHGGLFQWLAHMVTSSDHLLALLGLVLVVGGGCRRQLAAGHAAPEAVIAGALIRGYAGVRCRAYLAG